MTDLEWLASHPGSVKAIQGHNWRKPHGWSWCWGGPSGMWVEAFTLESAIAAARRLEEEEARCSNYSVPK